MAMKINLKRGFTVGFKSFVQSIYSVKSISANNLFSSYPSRRVAGVTVNVDSAMQLSTVYACIRDKAESIGQLPVKLFKRTKNLDEEIKRGRLHRIFTQRPNDFMTTQDFVETVETNLEARGVFYAYINFNDNGDVMEILPFRFQQNVHVNMDDNGNIYYIYTTNDGKPNIAASGKNIMRIGLNSFDGFTHLSPIACNARAIGLGMAQEDHLTNTMAKGTMPSGVLQTDAAFKDPKAAERIRKEFKEKYQGVDKNGEVIFLEQGLKYNPLSLSPADTELILQRQYSREEICGIFRVPPHRIGASTGAKKEDIEQANKDYYINKLMPIVRKIESAFNELTPDNFYIKFDERGFIRGDLKSQVDAYGELFKLTAISINELRAGADFQPIENGELHAIDTNNITLGNLDQVEELQAENREIARAGMNNQNNSDENKPVEENSDER